MVDPKRLSNAQFVHVTHLTGAPGGLTVSYLEGSDVVAVVAPRRDVADALTLPEMSRAGVYVLIGADADAPGRLIGYVGEAGLLYRRVGTHLTAPSKTFFERAVMLTTEGDRLSSEMTSHTERRLCDVLERTGLVRLVNSRRCAPRPLRADRRVVAERFVEGALVLLANDPCFGVLALQAAAVIQDTVDEATTSEHSTELAWARRLEQQRGEPGWPLYEMTRGPCTALARKSPAGGMRVLAGSRVAALLQSSCPRPTRRERERLQAAGALLSTRDPRTLILTREADLSSPTAAASLVAGAVLSGPRTWRAVPAPRSVGSVAAVRTSELGGAP